MKKIIFPLLFATASLAQQPDVNWVLSAGGTGQEYAKAICKSENNSIVVAGSFVGQLNIGNTVVNSVSGGSDLYIVKYSSADTVSMLKTFGNACHEQMAGVASDVDGNIYITGSFYSALSVDNTTVYSAGSKDIFIASFDIDGNLNWLQSYGGPGTDEGTAITIGADGSVYLAANMDQSGFAISDQASTGGSAHVAKFDSEGILLWSACESGDTQSNIKISSLVVDQVGSVFVTGSYFGQVTAGENGNVTLQSVSEQLWAGGYDQNGSSIFIYTLPQPGGNSNTGTSITLNANGNAVLSAYTIGSVMLNGNSFQSMDRDILILELTPTGTLVWGTVVESQGLQSPESIAISENGTIALGGLFIGDFVYGNTSLLNQGGSEGFMITFNQGTVAGLLSSSGQGNEIIRCMIPVDGGFISAGDFSGGMTASMNMGTQSVNSAGDQDYFISKTTLPSTTTVAEQSNGVKKVVSAYPNPATSTINFVYEANSDEVQVEIFSVTGSKAGSFQATTGIGQQVTLDITSLSPGAYHVQIKDGAQLVNSKFIVQ